MDDMYWDTGDDSASDEEEVHIPFNELKLDPRLLEVAAHLGFTHATYIQEHSIPLIQAGRDVVGQSGTGSGKTVAFGLPILEKIQPGKGIQALILTPTRELCVQIMEVMTEFSKPLGISVTSVYGGVGIQPQIDALKTADLVVATPGRTLDHLGQHTISFANTKFLVLDEADKMFEMGFYEDVERIVHHIPRERQTMLFTATLTSKVSALMGRHLNNPEMVRIHDYTDPLNLKQIYYDIRPSEKFSLLVHLLRNKTPGLAIVFCAARYEVDTLTDNLKRQGINVTPIHGGIEQGKRLKAINALREENVDVLVATDVAARGLDVKNISNVYNWSLPKTSEEYTHRIGRTARAGESGVAITILTPDDHENFRKILSDHSISVERAAIPRFPNLPYIRQERRDRGFGDRGPPRDSFPGGMRGPPQHRRGFGGGGRGPPRGRGADRPPLHPFGLPRGKGQAARRT